MWHDWNGVSLFYEKDFTTNFDMKLFSDASLIGFSAIFGSQWFCSAWPNQIPVISDGDLSLAFRELYPIVTAAVENIMELTELQENVNSLWDNAVSVRTLSAYETGLRSFQTFLLMNNLAQHMDPLPRVSEEVLCLYTAHCYRNLHLRYTVVFMWNTLWSGVRFDQVYQVNMPIPVYGILHCWMLLNAYRV